MAGQFFPSQRLAVDADEALFTSNSCSLSKFQSNKNSFDHSLSLSPIHFSERREYYFIRSLFILYGLGKTFISKDRTGQKKKSVPYRASISDSIPRAWDGDGQVAKCL